MSITCINLSDTPICVKKTFIEVDEPAPSQRFSSLPPSLRLAGSQRQVSSAAIRCASPTKDAASDHDDEELSTEADTSGAEDAGAEDTNSEADSGSIAEDISSNSADVPPVAVPHRRLNSQAKAWTPGASAVASQPMSRETMEFSRQLQGIAMAVKAVLVNCVFLTAVEAKESQSGWSVIARVTSRDAHQKETALTMAKESIIRSTEVSAPVYLLGYNARPFTDIVGGFGARFVGVANPHNVCWGLLQQGFCRHGEACRWKHPTYHRNINVVVVVTDN